MDKKATNNKIWLAVLYISLTISIMSFFSLWAKVEVFSPLGFLVTVIIWVTLLLGSINQAELMCKFDARYENQVDKIRFFVASFIFNLIFSMVLLALFVGVGSYFGLTFGLGGV